MAVRTKKIIQILGIYLFISFLSGCGMNHSNEANSIEPSIINSEKLTELAKDTNVLILDVRTPDEVAQGYIPGTTLFLDINTDDFETKLDQLDQSKKYIVYCKSGGRSSRAVETMSSKGFKHIFELEGGISSWIGELKK
jgi:rhodanese-related sulfurtransferase